MSGRRAPAEAPAVLDDIDRALINALQGDFPLSRQPFAEVGLRLGLPQETVLARVQRLLDARVLTRFGPMFQIERIGGAFCLAAMSVSEAAFEHVAAQVNGFPEVAHNYRREHALNMWFVLATELPDGIAECARRIEAATGLPVFLFPKEREYFVEMKLEA
ncbi:Lrp/AsnC family transcriptional regulator [Aromatoleum evansii]|uniref:Lrp/AsnC family transcriptional regulator n=1 Tax=Aromatoleum evansii TaxID=59406 RepID=UPI00145D74B3|nr:Lrp/AsnC family transcriptional regulator [Aromatoleum evansii]NMG28224.1 AsnC family transcriptional regulator [Aromatoleum evansii]